MSFLSYLDDLLGRNDLQLTFDDWEPDEVGICPLCKSVTRFWYVTAFNGDWDYLDSLVCHSCLKCDFQRFAIDEPDYS